MPHSLSDITEPHSSPSSPATFVGFGQEQLPLQEKSPKAVFPGFWVHFFFSAWGKRLGLGLLGLLLLLFSLTLWGAATRLDPYTESVLNLQGDVSHGASLFALNCAACHGEEANGRVGPSLRGVSSRRSERFIIQQVTSGNTPPMPQFQPDPQEMADLISYLKTL
ncbi:MAG: c-type cytochrome [Cyanobacteriota bacterium]